MTSVRKEFKAGSTEQERNTVQTLETCMLNVKSWMDAVRLKMNPTKTEFIYFGNRPQLHKCIIKDLNVAGGLVVRSHSIRYLSVYLDENL